MSYRQLIIVLAVLLSGCATCGPERILQLTPERKSTFKTTSHDQNAEDLFFFNERASVWLHSCDRNNTLVRGSICATIMVPPEHVVSLTSAEIRFVLEGDSARLIHIPNVSFLASCSSSSMDPTSCTPGDRGVKGLATRKIVQHYEYQGRWWTLYEVGVDALAELPGGEHADSSLGRFMAYGPYKLTAWHYTFPVIDNGLTEGGTLFLPALNVDGTLVELPPVKVTPKVANVCTRPPV
jgi:hypothetical protein